MCLLFLFDFLYLFRGSIVYSTLFQSYHVLFTQLIVRAWESRLIFKDIQYGSVKVDLADMEFTLPSVTETFSNEEKNVKVY